MRLLEQQQLFMRLLPRLLNAVQELGFECTAGELYRTPEQAALNSKKGSGISNSLHTKRLAIDIQLFDEHGNYLTRTEDYAVLGARWKSLHELARWGGDFKPRADGNHFSLERDGVK